MSATKQKSGRLVRDLTPREINAIKKSRSRSRPSEGNRVRMWRLAGLWAVWSAGPDVSTWWLLPIDDEARGVMDALAGDPLAGDPVVIRVESGAIAVRTTDIGA